MTEKIAVVAPIPRASVRIAAAVNPGARRIPRRAYRMSWMRISTLASSLCGHTRPAVRYP